MPGYEPLVISATLITLKVIFKQLQNPIFIAQ